MTPKCIRIKRGSKPQGQPHRRRLTALPDGDNGGAVGLWERVRGLAAGPRRRLAADLAAAYDEELRVAMQLRLHAERVPYPASAAQLLALAEHEDAHAAL